LAFCVLDRNIAFQWIDSAPSAESLRMSVAHLRALHWWGGAPVVSISRRLATVRRRPFEIIDDCGFFFPVQSRFHI
jgi:hypothetical protein